MKNLLTHFSKLSLDNSSRMTRKRLGIGSAISRKLFSVLAFLLFIGVGNVWGETFTKITSLASLTTGDYVIVGQKGSSDFGRLTYGTLSSSRIPYSKHYTSDNLPASTITTTTANEIWHIEVSGTGDTRTITIYNAGQKKYLNPGISWGNSSSNWTAAYSSGFRFKNPSATNYLGVNKDANYWKNYTSGTLYSSNTYCLTLYKAPSGFALTFKETGGSSNGSGLAAANATSMTISTAPTPATGKMVEGYYAENTLTTKVANADGSWAANNITGWVTSGKFTKGTAADLYIKWTDLVTTLTLDKGTDGTTDGTATITYNATSFTSKTDATKTGYHLSGYYTASSGGNKVINADGALVSSLSGWTSSGKWVKNATTEKLYAQWTIDDYTVSWSVNGNSWSTGVSSSNNHANYNNKITAMPTAPTSSNCDNTKVFVGWTATPIVGTQNTPPSDLFTAVEGSPKITQNTTFYAVFATNATTATRVTATNSITSGDRIAICNDKDSYILLSTFATAQSQPSENGSGEISISNANQQWLLNGDNTNGYTLTNGTIRMGSSGGSSGSSVSNNANRTLWTFTTSNVNSNCLAMTNKSSGYRLEYSGGWVHYNSTNASWTSLKIYKVNYTNYATSCCTKLGSINGSISLTQGGNSVTISGWSDVANVGTYTVRMYKKNGASWDLVSGTTSGGSAGTQGTRTGITGASKSVTYTGLEVESEYKFTVQAIAGSASYCDGDETAVTEINSTDVSSTPFKFRYAIYIDDGTNDNYEYHYITPTGNTDEGSVDIDLNAHVDYYQFKIAGGFSGWWGQTGTDGKIEATTVSDWTLNGSYNVRLKTGAAGDYVFTVDYSGTTNPKVGVEYPSADQDAGYVIYYDNSILNWSSLYYRIGNNSNCSKVDAVLVTGTDKFYKITTPDYDNMDAWHIANNYGWTGSNSVYRTKTNSTPAEAAKAITNSISFQQYVVTGDITVIPTTTHSTGGDTGDAGNNNCEFYTINTPTSGMLTHNISVGSADHGTVVATYTNTSGSTGQTVAEGANADLAHRCIVTITATPDAGYQLSSLTLNGDAFTSGNTHILTADATIAATFTAKTYNISLDREGATTGSENVTMTYNSADHTAITAPTKSGYDFGGWYTEDNGTGTQVMNASGVLQANVTGYTGAGGIWTKDATCTLYAKWTPTNYTLSYTLDGGNVASPNPTSYTIESAAITLNNPTKAGYDFAGWTGTGLAEATTTVTIAAGSTGNRSYTATWTIKKYTVTWHVGDATGTTSNVAHFTEFSTIKNDAAQPAHGDAALSACGSTKFIGWVKAGGVWDDEGKTSAWYDTYKAADADEITSDTHYYAMYAEGASTSKTFEFEITSSDFNSTSYAANNNEKTTTATATDASGATMDVKWTSYQIMLQSSAMQWQKNAGYIYNSTDLGTVNSVTFTKTAGVYSTAYGTSSQPSSGGAGTGKGYFKTTINNDATGSMTSYVVNFTKSITTYSNYRTGCTVTCSRPTPATPASITKTGATISWTDPATSGTLDHYEYKVWADGEDEPVSGTTNGTNLSKELTGLYSGVTYHWKVRRVCSGADNNSIWAAGSDFTTTNAALTFSVPTGVSEVAASTTASNLPSAGVATDCGNCWEFVGWTANTSYSDDDAPTDLMLSGTKAKVSGDKTLYAVYASGSTYKRVSEASELTPATYLVTFTSVGQVYALSSDVHSKYATDAVAYNIQSTIEKIGDDFYSVEPKSAYTWTFAGNSSAGTLYNATGNKYVNMGTTTILQASSGNMAFTFSSTDSTWTVKSASYYLHGYVSTSYGTYPGFEATSGSNSVQLYKRVVDFYATSPDCSKYTVTWDINNGATTSTTNVTKCQGYLASLPSAPADNTLVSCIPSDGKFVGWSANKVMPATNTRPSDLFADKENAPEITEDITFYAVFAQETTGGEAAINTTYTFTSKSWGDATNSWNSTTDGNELTSGRGIKVLGSESAVGVTKNNFKDVTKVVVTYCTNASTGAGSIAVSVGETSYGSNTISKPSSGGTTLKTFEYTHAATTGTVTINASASANSIYIYSVQIFYTGATTTYEGYRTACCDDADFKFVDATPAEITEYTIVREDLTSSSDYRTWTYATSSSNSTGTISWASTARQKSDNNTAFTWSPGGTNQSSSGEFYVDVANTEIKAKRSGVYVVTLSQASGGTTYCDENASITITVKTVDKFIDAVNGNFSGEPQSLEDVGNGITLPTAETFSTDNGCADGTTRRLLGWIKASDLATYASGRRVNTIDDLKTGDASNKVIAPGTKVQATGVTWYAVWGVEK